jgi:hypothetical protein
MIDLIGDWVLVLCVALVICMSRELIDSVRNYGKANEIH